MFKSNLLAAYAPAHGSIMGWMHDITVQTEVERGQFMETTGGHVWEAARHLIRFIEAEATRIGMTQ